MLSKETVRGIWAGMPVAWTGDAFDETRYRQNVRRTCQAGAHGVYTAGTTGEFYAQTFEEWQAIGRATIEESHALGVPVQIGVTDVSTRLVARRARVAAELGADAIQLAMPFWMALSQSEAVRFFADVAQAVPGMPMVLYGTGRAKTITTVALMRAILDAGVPLVGCKYTGSLSDLPEFLKTCPEVSFLVGEGDLANGMQLGARGSCSAYIYVCPRYMLRMYRFCLEGRWDEARAIQNHVKDWLAGPCQPLFKKGMVDSALDRTFAHAAGFIDIEMACQPPYVAGDEQDLAQYVQLCEAGGFGEFLHDVED